MNRRRFISNLASVLAAASGPSVLALEAFDRFKWKTSGNCILFTPGNCILFTPNPEWIDAPHEIVFAWNLSPPEPWIYSKAPMRITYGMGINRVEYVLDRTPDA